MPRFLAVSVDVAVTDDPFQKKQILRRLVEGDTITGLQLCIYHFRISDTDDKWWDGNYGVIVGNGTHTLATERAAAGFVRPIVNTTETEGMCTFNSCRLSSRHMLQWKVEAAVAVFVAAADATKGGRRSGTSVIADQ
eukprot:scaffold6429_cov77-Skeletonema_dohrnii-CCMP3373.AAC.8